MLIFITACESTPTKNKSELMNLSFVDMEDFDQNLSESMSANLDTIHVKMIGPVSINQIPNRLGKWLSVVRDKNGHVDLTAKKNTPHKSNGDNEVGTNKLPILLILGALPSTYNFLKQESIYGIAANYNVKIFYNSESGKIEKLIFRRKAE
jgi:hypothetical protein